MKPDEKDRMQNPSKAKSSTALKIASLIISLIAIALLINNILLYKNTINSYVAQGYPAADVMKQLIPSQLIPGIFEPVALYGGIALALFGIGIINKRNSDCMALLNRDEDYSEAGEGNNQKENIIDAGENDNKS